MDDPERVTLTFEEMDAIYDPYRPNLQNGALLVNDDADQFEGNGLDINTNDLQSDIVPYDGDNIDIEIPGIAAMNTPYNGPVMTQVRGTVSDDQQLNIRRDKFIVCTPGMVSQYISYHNICIIYCIRTHIYHMYVYIDIFIYHFYLMYTY